MNVKWEKQHAARARSIRTFFKLLLFYVEVAKVRRGAEPNDPRRSLFFTVMFCLCRRII